MAGFVRPAFDDQPHLWMVIDNHPHSFQQHALSKWARLETNKL